MPTTLVRGANSVFVNDEDAAEFARIAPGFQGVHMVEDSGHSVQSDQPRALVDILRGVLPASPAVLRCDPSRLSQIRHLISHVAHVTHSPAHLTGLLSRRQQLLTLPRRVVPCERTLSIDAARRLLFTF